MKVGAVTDAVVLFALCVAAGESAVEPLAPREWSGLAERMAAAGMAAPAELAREGAIERLRAAGEREALLARLERLCARIEAARREAVRLARRGVALLAVTDRRYPTRLRARLERSAPPLLFARGDLALLDRPALAVVGSRAIDGIAAAFARAVGERCAGAGWSVVSGAARGSDYAAMAGALAAGGAAIAVVPGPLAEPLRHHEFRRAFDAGRLLLLARHAPDAPFEARLAQARNPLIYALADYALVVASAQGHGGTWGPAVATLRRGWPPLFVRAGEGIPAGNRALLALGARPFPSLAEIDRRGLGEALAAAAPGRERAPRLPLPLEGS